MYLSTITTIIKIFILVDKINGHEATEQRCNVRE
jgi:hypothetical protein